MLAICSTRLPFATTYIMFVQSVVMLLVLCMYDIAPVSMNPKEESGSVKVAGGFNLVILVCNAC